MDIRMAPQRGEVRRAVSSAVSTWGVVLSFESVGSEGETASPGSWFARGREAYFEGCPRLAAFLGAQAATLTVTAERVGPVMSEAGGGGVTIGVSVVEVRAASFDMAIRIRSDGDADDEPAGGRCTIVIERRADGERIAIPREVRDELIALQLAARDYL